MHFKIRLNLPLKMSGLHAEKGEPFIDLYTLVVEVSEVALVKGRCKFQQTLKFPGVRSEERRLRKRTVKEAHPQSQQGDPCNCLAEASHT